MLVRLVGGKSFTVCAVCRAPQCERRTERNAKTLTLRHTDISKDFVKKFEMEIRRELYW